MLKQVFLPALLSSSAVFCTFGFAIALIGSKPVDIRLDDDQLYKGEVRKMFSPPAAGLLSIGMGFGTAAVLGWRHAARQSWQAQQELNNLQRDIQQKQTQIEALKHKPLSVGVPADFFQDEVVQDSVPKPPAKLIPIQNSTVSAQPVVVTPKAMEVQASPTSKLAVKTAVSGFTSAQTVLGLTHMGDSPNSDSMDMITPVQELHGQLQEMKAKLRLVQTALQMKAQSETREVSAPTQLNGEYPA